MYTFVYQTKKENFKVISLGEYSEVMGFMACSLKEDGVYSVDKVAAMPRLGIGMKLYESALCNVGQLGCHLVCSGDEMNDASVKMWNKIVERGDLDIMPLEAPVSTGGIPLYLDEDTKTIDYCSFLRNKYRILKGKPNYWNKDSRFLTECVREGNSLFNKLYYQQ